MQLSDADTELLKAWIIKKLEDVSDADSDVLADYVLALVKTDDPEPVAKANCVDNLRDFLGSSAESFVEDVFTAITEKEYDPLSRPKPRDHMRATAASFESSEQQNQSRKRGYDDWDADDSHSSQKQRFGNHNRPTKQMRRGRGGFDTHRGRTHRTGAPSMPTMPMPPPGMPPFDPTDPMAALLAMQQVMGMMPGMPGAPMDVGPQNGNGQRCRDYDTKGFCARGASCPYEHGNDSQVFGGPDQYDPSQAHLLDVQPSRTGVVPYGRGRGGRRGKDKSSGAQRGGKRAQFSNVGPNHDRSITSIVVEQIPDDKFNEESIRDFFREFGNITDVTMQPFKRLAIVKFEDYDSAKAAYDSPKVIFDNRFVKVYWYKPESQQRFRNNAASDPSVDQEKQEEPNIDPEEIARRQEELQKKYEEKKKHHEEAFKKREELDSKLKAMDAERREMMAKLTKKTGQGASPVVEEATTTSQESEQTKGLRAQLAKLEAEAKSMGIDPEVTGNSYDSSTWQSRGRGGYRGRPRGRGYFQGTRGGRGGGAVRRLDNRPKTVAVTFTTGAHDEHDETLRQWLLFNSAETAELIQHPDRADSALVSFPERYLGEVFMASASSPDFPLAGKIELSWYQPNATNGAQDSDTKVEANVDSSDVAMQEDTMPARDFEAYDVAEDDDRWA